MAGTFKFELVSPERVLLAVDADQAMVPGIEGDFTVFAGHAPLISALRPGVLEVLVAGAKKQIFVKSGFADVNAGTLTVLAETAFDVADTSPSQIAEEIAIAEASLAAAKDDDSRTLAQTAIDRLRSLGGKAA
jgi:F-type H+-transporting ATPase subunit epsilon